MCQKLPSGSESIPFLLYKASLIQGEASEKPRGKTDKGKKPMHVHSQVFKFSTCSFLV